MTTALPRLSAALCSISVANCFAFAAVRQTVVVTALKMLRSASHLLLVVMTDASWCLDPSKLPQRLDFEVSDHAYECLQRLSAKAGISVRDLAERLISQSVGSLQLRS
jgi:predicted component of type VI protein secretion system